MKKSLRENVQEIPFKPTKNQNRYLAPLRKNYYSTPEYYLLFKEIKKFSLLVIKTKSSVRHTFAFYRVDNEIIILNSVTGINSEYLTIACKYLFDKYPASQIRITNVYLTGPMPNVHFVSLPANSDMIIHLPGSENEYINSLGKKTRKHLKQYLKILNDESLHFNFSFLPIKPTNSLYVKQIVNMNRLRMKNKGQVSHLDDVYQNKLIKLAEIFGWFGIAKINGKIVAGTLCFKTENEYYLQIISHNPAFDKFELGQVVLYLTIQECIKARGKRFHLLWGNAQYKYRFLGTMQSLYSYIIFRSRSKMFLYSLYYLPFFYGNRLIKSLMYKALNQVVAVRSWIRKILDNQRG